MTDTEREAQDVLDAYLIAHARAVVDLQLAQQAGQYTRLRMARAMVQHADDQVAAAQRRLDYIREGAGRRVGSVVRNPRGY